MKNGICPKCGSKEVYTDKNKFMKTDYNALMINMFSTALIEHYVCTDCGYVERYADNNKLEKVKKHWEKQGSY